MSRRYQSNPQAMALFSRRVQRGGAPELMHSVDEDTWLTPRYILDQIGSFDLDPCAASVNPHWVCERVFTKEQDGLSRPWRGRVFMNPPYSDTATWLHRHAEHGDGIALVPASVESQVWRDVVWKRAANILLLHGRTRFCNPDGSTTRGRPLRSIALIAWTEYDAGFLESSALAGSLLNQWRLR